MQIHIRNKSISLLGTFVFALGATLLPIPAARSAEGTVASTDASEPGLEEITVTAERREANLQTIPVSIYAFSNASLEKANVDSVLDLGKLVPSALIQQNQGGVTTFLRGVGNDIVTVGNEASNAIYIDDVYYSRLTSSILRLNNIDRIEVLEGPQGTLFGRNATGGLIQIITRTPEVGSAPLLDANIGYGSFQTSNANAYMASGFGPRVAGDLSLSHYDNPGFGRDVYDGAQANYERASTARSKWVFEPGDTSKLTFIAEYLRSNSDIGLPGQFPGGPSPGLGNTGLPLTGGLLGALGYYDRNQDYPSFLESESYGGSLRAEQTFSFAKVVDIVAYHHEKEIFSSDADYTPQFFKTAVLPSYTYLFTNELQIQSLPSSPLEWTGGLFYLHATQGYRGASLAGLGFVGAPPPLSLQFFSAEPTTSYAAYGQTTFPIAESLKLTLGARYSNDLVHGNGGINLLSGPGAPIVPVVPFGSVSDRNQQFSWKGALNYQVNTDLMTYASVSRGYKAGLYNLLTFDPTFVKPEILTAYEVGAKSDLLNSRLRLNGAVFFYNIEDPQAEIAVGGLPALVNAQKEQVKGAQFTAEALVTKQLHVNVGVTYLDAQYTDFRDAPFYTVAPGPGYGLSAPTAGNADGNRPSRAPVFSENIGSSYTLSTADGDWTLAANYAHTGLFYWTPDNRVAQRAYGLLDAHVAYAIGATGLKIKAWGSNLTNAKYVTEEYESAGAQGDISAAGPPRQYGLNVEYKTR
jgi:iron complex outermembrane receptor protein